MSSAITDSWSQAGSKAFSITSSPMSPSLDLNVDDASGAFPDHHIQPFFEDASIATLAPGAYRETVNSFEPQSRAPADALRDMKRSKYCMSKDDIFTAIAEDTVFELHSFFFKRGSERFRELLENHEDMESPIILIDTVAIDLERFLDLLYPSEIGDYSGKTPEEWMSILRVAYRWGFHSIHQFASVHLEALASPVDKIVCARSLGMDDWLIGAYADLCERKEVLSLDEGRRLGLAEVICLYDARDEVRSTSLKEPDDMRPVIERKLESHGLVDKRGAIISDFPTKLEDAAFTPATNADGVRPDEHGVPTGNAKNVYTYNPPRVHIVDQKGRIVLGDEPGDEITCRLFPSQEYVHIRRQGIKLFIKTAATSVLHINGKTFADENVDKMAEIEFRHGDVIVFAKQAFVSPVDGSVICLPDTGYIVCRDDAFASLTKWPVTGWKIFEMKKKGSMARARALWKELQSAVELADEAKAFLAAQTLCVVQGVMCASILEQSKGVVETAKRKGNPLQEIIGAALGQAKKPYIRRGWLM